MKRLIAALGAALAIMFAGAVSAWAGPQDPPPAGDSYAACNYQRYWTADGCTFNGVTYHWTISDQAGCQEEKAINPSYYATDTFCHPKKTHSPRTYVVKRHQTLWRIAVIAYGSRFAYHEKAGHLWVQIAKANHIHGTRIHPGQVLVIP